MFLIGNSFEARFINKPESLSHNFSFRPKKKNGKIEDVLEVKWPLLPRKAMKINIQMT